MEIVKITHQNLKVCKEKINVPINYLKISDPEYDNDVPFRYEKDNLQMCDIHIALKHEHIDVSERGFCDDYGELIIILSDGDNCGVTMEKRDYDIGVDSAKYVFETEHGSSQIHTAADGVWGHIEETYIDGVLGMIKINMPIPDEDAITEEEFIESITGTMKLHDIHFEEVIDRKVDFDLSDVQEMEMNTMNMS